MSRPILIEVIGKDGASAALKTIERELHSLGGAAQAESGRTGGFFKGLAATAGGFLTANVIGGIGRQFAGFVGSVVQESRDAAHGLAQTESAIKSTGGAAHVTAQQIVDFSGALSKHSLFTDDAIQAEQNLMLTFTNVKNAAGAGNDIFNQSTQIALDMAQAMGTDAAGGAIQLGKALNDPVAGITALTRVGVTFDAAQKAQIKSMVAAGNTIGAQKIILHELSKEFGGSAEAAMKADGGFHLFQQRMDDVKQTLGDAFMPALTGAMGVLSGPFLDAVTAAGTSLAGSLTTGIQWISETGLPAMRNAWDNVTTGFTFNGVGGAIQAVIGDIGQFIPALKPVTDFIGRNFWAVWDTTAGVIGVARDAFITFTQALSGNWVDASGILPFHAAIGETGLVLHDFAGWVTTIGQELAGGDWSGAFDTLTTGLTNFGTTIGATVSTWAGEFVTWIPTAIADIQAALPGIWDTVSTWIANQAGPIVTQMEVWGSQFVAWVPTAITDVQNALPGIWDAVSTWIGDQVATITTKLGDWASAFVAWVGPAIPPFLDAVGAFATGIGTAIANGVPIIVEKVKLWATEFVAWIQRDALPKLQPAFDAFLTTLATQADRATTVLNAAGNKAGQSMVEGLKLGWAAAPVETSNVMVKMAGEIDKNRPLIMAVMKTIGEAGITSMVDSMNTQTGIQLPSIQKQIAVALLGFIPSLGIAAGQLGLSIAESWYKGAYDQFQKLFPGLNALGTSMGKLLADGLNTAGALIVTAAQALGKAMMDGIAAGFGNLATWVAGKVLGALAGAITLVRAGQRIQSPSRVWAEQVGEPLAQGIAAGMEAGAANMNATATSVVGGMIDAARAVLTGARLSANLDTHVTYTGAKDPLAYLAPSMREMPAWIGYVKDLGNGLTLLGPRTDWMAGAATNAQDLGNGLTLLGDQWARQADGMTDLAPKLPQLAAGFTGVADAAKAAAAATTRATDDILNHISFKGEDSDPFSFLTKSGGLGASADYAKQAGQGAGMGFGDGWKAGIEQIAPVIQDTTRMQLLSLQPMVFDPWKQLTDDYMSGAGFGFAGSVATGIGSAGGDVAASAARVGGAAGAALVGSLRGNLAGVGQAVADINAALAKIERDITVHVHTVYDGTGGSEPPHRASGGPVTAGRPYIVGENRSELFVPQEDGYILPRVPSALAMAGQSGTGRAERVTETHNHYHLTIHTTAPSVEVPQEFGIMSLLAG